MANNFDFPGDGPIVGSDAYVTPAFAQWCQRVQNSAQALQQSGTTADRPTRGVWIGRPYFDTTLALPIWYDANGVTGWCNGAGANV